MYMYNVHVYQHTFTYMYMYTSCTLGDLTSRLNDVWLLAAKGVVVHYNVHAHMHVAE